VLTNEQATHAGILQKLAWLTRNGTENDTYLLYLAGHAGYPENGNNYYFFVQTHSKSEWTEDFNWTDLVSRFTEAKGRTILLVDTCHAAGAAGGGNYAWSFRAPGSSERSALFTFAGSASAEQAIEPTKLKHGLFTYALLESMKEPGSELQKDVLFSDVLAVRIRQQMDRLQSAGRLQNPTHFVLPLGVPAAPLFAIAP
jgi:uncharacterized caspase-like protein